MKKRVLFILCTALYFSCGLFAGQGDDEDLEAEVASIEHQEEHQDSPLNCFRDAYNRWRCRASCREKECEKPSCCCCLLANWDGMMGRVTRVIKCFCCYCECERLYD